LPYIKITDLGASSGDTTMSAKVINNIDLVKSWYVHFEKRDLNWIVSAFADDAILTVGDGDSEGSVAYGGRFVGIDQIKYYYTGRFLKADANPVAVIRPFCGFTNGVEQQFGRWVIMGGEIEDSRGDRSLIYKGKFLHVWSINPADGKIASLSMFFDAEAVL
jgi:hypothetical protein